MNFLITGYLELALEMNSALTMIIESIEDMMIIPFLANETAAVYRQKMNLKFK